MTEGKDGFHINKWYTFAACAFLQLSSGLAYTFPIYSSHLKDKFDWDQTKLDGFSTFLNLGAFGAFIPGILYSYLEKYGRVAPRVSLSLSVAMSATGMGLIWGATTGHVDLTYVQLLVAAFFFTNANAFMDVTAVTVSVINWPNDRGYAVGVMKAAVGLSGGIYTTVYTTLLQPNIESFLLFSFIFCPLSVFLAIPWINEVPWVQRSETVPYGLLTTSARFLMAYQILLSLAAFNIIAAFVVNDNTDDRVRMVVIIILVTLVASLALTTVASGGVRSIPAHLYLDPEVLDNVEDRRPPDSVLSHPLKMDSFVSMLLGTGTSTDDGAAPPLERLYTVDSSGSSGHQDLMCSAADNASFMAATEDALQPLLGSVEHEHSPRGPDSQGSHDGSEAMRSQTSIASELYHEQVAQDVHPLRAIFTLELLSIMFMTFSVMGTALGVIDNIPQLLQSISPDNLPMPVLQQNLLIVFFVCNMCGRLIGGYLPERALHIHGTPRPIFFVIVACMTLAWTVSATITSLCAGSPWAPPVFYPIVALLGLSFGASWTLMATIVSELFGLRYFASNYALVQLASMLASFFPTVVVARLYDVSAAIQHPDDNDPNIVCLGYTCFLSAFLTMTFFAILQLIVSIYLWRRTLWIYYRMADHIREVDQAIVEEGAFVW